MYHCLFAIQALTMLVTGFWHSRGSEFSVPPNTVHSKRYRNGTLWFPGLDYPAAAAATRCSRKASVSRYCLASAYLMN